jgi:hypothetical protein
VSDALWVSNREAAKPSHTQKVLSTGELLCWVVAFFAAISICYAAKSWWTGSKSTSIFSAVELIAWGCALRLILGDPAKTRPSSTFHVFTVAGIALCVLFVPVRSSAMALIPLGLFVLLFDGWSVRQRRAGAIFIALGCQRLLGSVIPVLFGDVILKLDTAGAGLLMQFFVPGTTWSGNVLKPPGDPGITVFMGCSSFANLSFVILCFTSLYAADGGRSPRRAMAAVTCVCGCVILLNTLRLVAAAKSLDSYIYWHNGTGAEIFGVVMTILTVALCSMGSRWASECR